MLHPDWNTKPDSPYYFILCLCWGRRSLSFPQFFFFGGGVCFLSDQTHVLIHITNISLPISRSHCIFCHHCSWLLLVNECNELLLISLNFFICSQWFLCSHFVSVLSLPPLPLFLRGSHCVVQDGSKLLGSTDSSTLSIMSVWTMGIDHCVCILQYF